MNQNDLLNECGCCENSFDNDSINNDVQKNIKLFPLLIHNRPGLTDIKYRIGTHSKFKSNIIESIALTTPLDRLAYRSNDDFVIALFDAWATVADVLTFYQERIANESYLRTAKERLSVLQLARSIGYELRPGVAATTKLAFLIEDAPGSVEKTIIDIGTKVQSLPAQGEMPQIFETTEKIEAKPQFNELRPKLTKPQIITKDTTSFYFKGLNNQLKIGDRLLVVIAGNEFSTFNIVSKVELQPLEERTFVTVTPIKDPLKLFNISSKTPVVYAFRTKTAAFGHNAPFYKSLPDAIQGQFHDWDDPRLPVPINKKPHFPKTDIGYLDYGDNGNLIYLDNSYPAILKDSWVVIQSSDDDVGWKAYKIKNIHEETLSEFALSVKSMGLTLDITDNNETDNLSKFYFRKTTIYAQSEELILSEKPTEKDYLFKENTILLDSKIKGLLIGQQISITGKTVDSSGDGTGLTETEIAIISDIDEKNQQISFEKNLERGYKKETMILNANIANASHGETKQEEVIGTGDPSQKHQEFLLKENPLTFVSATTAESVKSTLEIRVNDILWKEAPSLYYLKPNDHAYTVRIENDGRTRVIFGDGIHGARLAEDIENLKAKYRVGIGSSGLLKKDQLSLLMSRPLGVRSVTNPKETIGADNPENIEQARTNAPLTISTIDRIVSLLDFEIFAKSFAGIGKAQAIWIWDGELKKVYITVASSNGEPLTSDSILFQNLVQAIKDLKDPMIKFSISSFDKLTFDLDASILVAKEREPEKVFVDIKNSLIEKFSFSSRHFGQSVGESEIMSVIQQVKGVEAVDIDNFFITGKKEEKKKFESSILAKVAKWDDKEAKIMPAELLLINPKGINLEIMTL
jgi:hypothetical protein